MPSLFMYLQRIYICISILHSANPILSQLSASLLHAIYLNITEFLSLHSFPAGQSTERDHETYQAVRLLCERKRELLILQVCFALLLYFNSKKRSRSLKYRRKRHVNYTFIDLLYLYIAGFLIQFVTY